jgi:hypothetical protein
MFIVLLSGCGTTQPDIPTVKTTKYFNIKNVSLHLTQKVKTDIVYHTQKELQELLKNDIEKKLADKNLLSNDASMTKLVIDVSYTRHFVGDATPMSSDSLAYPNMNYTIKAYDGKKLLTTIEKKDLTYQGGFAMNLQVIAGTLRDKKYELDFINALANTIVNNIEEIHNQ